MNFIYRKDIVNSLIKSCHLPGGLKKRSDEVLLERRKSEHLFNLVHREELYYNFTNTIRQ